MREIFVFLINGFEEIEAVATVDILRRAGLPVRTISLTGREVVTGGHGIPVTADFLFEKADFSGAEMLVLPGGTIQYNNHDKVKELFRNFYSKGGKVAANCASPMIFGELGMLKGRKATSYPGFEKYLDGAILQTDKTVVVDGNVITGKGPAPTIDFALALVEILAGKAKREEIASQIIHK